MEFTRLSLRILRTTCDQTQAQASQTASPSTQDALRLDLLDQRTSTNYIFLDESLRSPLQHTNFPSTRSSLSVLTMSGCSGPEHEVRQCAKSTGGPEAV